LGSSIRCNSSSSAGHFGLDRGDLLARHIRHLGVFEHLARLGQAAFELPESLEKAGYFAHLGVLAREGAIALHVLRDIGLLQEEVEFLKADRVAFQLLAEKGFSWVFLSCRT
jgi:hypothetical protein